MLLKLQKFWKPTLLRATYYRLFTTFFHLKIIPFPQGNDKITLYLPKCIRWLRYRKHVYAVVQGGR